MLASLPTRHQQQSHHTLHPTSPSHTQYWSSPSSTSTSTSTTSRPSLSNTQPRPVTTANNVFSFNDDPPLFDYDTSYLSGNPQPLMLSEPVNSGWLENGQLTPKSATRAHHNRAGSLSSWGSAGPSSPFTANTSNPQIVGDSYHDFQEFSQLPSKALTPTQAPAQDHFTLPHYSNYYPNNSFSMGGHDGLPKVSGADFNQLAVANDSSSTPSTEANNGYHAPKLMRTITDARQDELYMDYQQMTSAPSTLNSAPAYAMPTKNDAITQLLKHANNSHLNASNVQQSPLTIPSRNRDRGASPFRQGSPLAPTSNSFEAQPPYSSERDIRQSHQAISHNDGMNQMMTSSDSKTISPKLVENAVYDGPEEDIKEEVNFPPLYSSQQSQNGQTNYRQQPLPSNESLEHDDNTSQRSYGSMATTRRESSSAYSTASQNGQQQVGFSFTPASASNGGRRIPQSYPFVPQIHQQPSNLSSTNGDFPSTLRSMESSSSEYAPEPTETRRPTSTTADTGTYTCTYHGCTLRFDTPKKLQTHKREGHRNSAVAISGGSDGGMTSAAQRNSQAGPHKCERINPSTGKPCDTIFSRPYDLTRHEDTIHNARKQKVHCPYCQEEKTFSRADALTRHLRVVHPEKVENLKRRRGGGM